MSWIHWTHGLLIVLALCFTVGIAHGEEPVYPLQPPDRSSPRATLKTFLNSTDALGAFLAQEYLPSPSHAKFQRLVTLAAATETAVVIDEAYGEYIDPDEAPCSCARLLAAHPHLMVLRTFSKIYGLPNLRVGVFMSANPDYRRGVLAYRPTFPLSWFSLYTCQLALLDDDWLIEARSRLSRRKPILEAGLDALTGFERLPSQVNTIMFRHRRIPAAEVQHQLADHGVLVANLDQVSGIQNQGWLRMTVRSEADNAVFLAACAVISTGD